MVAKREEVMEVMGKREEVTEVVAMVRVPEERAGEEKEICDCICTTVDGCRCRDTGRRCHSCVSSNTTHSDS